MNSYIPGESKIHEVELLGEVGKEPGEKEWRKWLAMDPEEVMELTKQMQPAVLYRNQFNPEGVAHSPTCPAPDFANQVHAELTNTFDLWAEMDRLKYFIGIHGPSDQHGVDAWFEYQAPDGRLIVATIDHTEDPKKDNPFADYILFVNPDKDMDNGPGFEKFVKRAAKGLADVIQRKGSYDEG